MIKLDYKPYHIYILLQINNYSFIVQTFQLELNEKQKLAKTMGFVSNNNKIHK